MIAKRDFYLKKCDRASEIGLPYVFSKLAIPFDSTSDLCEQKSSP